MARTAAQELRIEIRRRAWSSNSVVRTSLHRAFVDVMFISARQGGALSRATVLFIRASAGMSCLWSRTTSLCLPVSVCYGTVKRWIRTVVRSDLPCATKFLRTKPKVQSSEGEAQQLDCFLDFLGRADNLSNGLEAAQTQCSKLTEPASVTPKHIQRKKPWPSTSARDKN